jgi:hypothetical protein
MYETKIPMEAEGAKEAEGRLAMVKLAVDFLNNHLMRFGNHAGLVPGEEYGQGIQLSLQEHTPPQIVEPLTEALTHAARFLAVVFAEAAEPEP